MNGFAQSAINWTERNVGLTSLTCYAVAFDPADPLNMFLGTGAYDRIV